MVDKGGWTGDSAVRQAKKKANRGTEKEQSPFQTLKKSIDPAVHVSLIRLNPASGRQVRITRSYTHRPSLPPFQSPNVNVGGQTKKTFRSIEKSPDGNP